MDAEQDGTLALSPPPVPTKWLTGWRRYPLLFARPRVSGGGGGRNTHLKPSQIEGSHPRFPLETVLCLSRLSSHIDHQLYARLLIGSSAVCSFIRLS